ncbi:MAG TPA: IgGFc-binding protein, partial [Bacteroidia bacterium]|nr:IgGFc-binding protein [Bacteroidia bacterium]
MNLCNLTRLHDHRRTSPQCSFMLCNNFKNHNCFRGAFRFSVNILILLLSSFQSFSQGVIPTKGKDFWIGFPYNPDFGVGTRRCDVFITSDVSTSGTITIPQQGWSQAFTVTANQTTSITLPIIQVEHIASEVIENKGVEVITQDTVSVFAISFQTYTADATVIYPKQSLGTEYRIASYKGLSNSSPPNLNSELLVVSTEDGTQVLINPVVPTLGGHPAGIPFTVNLDAGESYQVLSSTYSNDLTGTVIKATDSSGSCRPFAVFSGSTCVNIPPGCGACDILYEQALPVANWGKTYYAVPFSFATDYTLRVLADQNGTSYSIDGGAPTFLNAGQFTEINNIPGSRCVIANKPVSVIQYMQGLSCAGAGDP